MRHSRSDPVEPKFVLRRPCGSLHGRRQRPRSLCLFGQLSHRLEARGHRDVEAATAVRQAEVLAAKTMIERTADHLDVRPSRLARTGLRFGGMSGCSSTNAESTARSSSTNRSAQTGPFHAPSSHMTRKRRLCLPAGSSCRDTGAHSRRRGPARKDNTITDSKFDCDACALKPSAAER